MFFQRVAPKFRIKKPTANHLFERVVIKSWWVVGFFILCYAAYEQSIAQTNARVRAHKKELAELAMQKACAELLQQDLLLQINSQSDYAWIELTLMKGLGLVPENQTKVFFANNNK